MAKTDKYLTDMHIEYQNRYGVSMDKDARANPQRVGEFVHKSLTHYRKAFAEDDTTGGADYEALQYAIGESDALRKGVNKYYAGKEGKKAEPRATDRGRVQGTGPILKKPKKLSRAAAVDAFRASKADAASDEKARVEKQPTVRDERVDRPSTEGMEDRGAKQEEQRATLRADDAILSKIADSDLKITPDALEELTRSMTSGRLQAAIEGANKAESPTIMLEHVPRDAQKPWRDYSEFGGKRARNIVGAVGKGARLATKHFTALPYAIAKGVGPGVGGALAEELGASQGTAGSIERTLSGEPSSWKNQQPGESEDEWHQRVSEREGMLRSAAIGAAVPYGQAPALESPVRPDALTPNPVMLPYPNKLMSTGAREAMTRAKKKKKKR